MKTLFLKLLVFSILISPLYLLAQESRSMNLDPFDHLVVSGTLDVFLERGNSPSIRYEVEGLPIDRVIIKEKEGTLFIYEDAKKKGGGYYKDYSGAVYLTFDYLESVKGAGTADIIYEGRLNQKGINFVNAGTGDIIFDDIYSKNLTATISGTGNINLPNLDCEEVYGTVSGTGDLLLRGKAYKSKLVVSGVGKITSVDLDAEDVHATVSGIGTINTRASGNLVATTTGIGNIYYVGQPENLVKRSPGFGKIRAKN